jgi:hypothetical protein
MTDTSGPEYPPPSPPASFDIWKTIASQYANSNRVDGVISSFYAAADKTPDFDTWYRDVWDVDTAKDYGLDIWGRIVGVNRVVYVQTVSSFGFQEAGASTWNTGVGFSGGIWTESDLNQGGDTFYSGSPLTSSYRLETESYRKLILAKASANISDSSIHSINRIMMLLFPGPGNCYCTDGIHTTSYFGFNESSTSLTFGDGVFYDGQAVSSMSMQYVFEFPLSPVELAIVEQSGVLPKPTGVSASVVLIRKNLQTLWDITGDVSVNTYVERLLSSSWDVSGDASAAYQVERLLSSSWDVSGDATITTDVAVLISSTWDVTGDAAVSPASDFTEEGLLSGAPLGFGGGAYPSS